MNRNLFLLLFLSMIHIARGQTTGELRYWFDDDYSSVQTVADAVGNHSIDVSALAEGIHMLHSMVVDENGQATPVVSHAFFKPYSTPEVSVTSCRYWFDNDTEHVVTTPYSNEAVMLDVSTLTNGLHFLYIQADGTMQTPVVSRMFAVVPEMSVEGKTHAELVINGQVLQEAEVPENGGTIDWSVDVSSLPNGLLTAYVTLYSEQNVALSTYSSVFWKIPTGRKNLVGYEYWVNDGEALGRVELQEPVENYTLQTLLPVTTHPIRSCCFAFRVEEGQPYIYAKNDIRIRFHDDMNRFYDVEEKFVDENIKQVVTDVELLESGVQVTTACPGENSIKWYKVEAVRGDSLAFKTNVPCSVNLFSSSGQELYCASGTDAVNFDGSRAPEDGTYYLAVHDVTAKNANTLNVDYQHIDKYAVLQYTPNEIGVSETIVEMKLDGNGFDKLTDAELQKGTSKLTPSEIFVESKSIAVLRFIINGNEDLGSYSLSLNFKDGEDTDNLTIENAVNLVVADFGEVLVDIVTSPTTGRPYPVTVKVTNTGNVGLLYVPFNIAYDNTKYISRVHFNNFFVTISEAACENGDSVVIRTDNFLGEGINANVIDMFIPKLGPKETKNFVLGFTAPNHYRFNLYAWVGESLNKAIDMEPQTTNIPSLIDYLNFAEELTNENKPVPVKRRVSSHDDILNIAQDMVDNTETMMVVDGLTQNSVNNKLDTWIKKGFVVGASVTIGYNSTDTPSQIIPYQKSSVETNTKIREHRQNVVQNPTPFPDSKNVFIMNPNDPNDIFGYMAESGSKYVQREISTVGYTIEFENDPEVATAAAHTIVVTDTLDASRFDLTSFAARSVKIGNKVMELDGEKDFVKTMDLRPAVEVIAQVSLEYDETNGIAKWTIESLDPMSMEPTTNAFQGALPVNVDGNGTGELAFDIKLKNGLTNGDEVNNRAGIIFDQEDVIMTPTWTNIIDTTPPQSHVANVTKKDDATLSINVEASDALSGIWKYDLYCQKNLNKDWDRIGVNVPVDSVMEIALEDAVNYRFYAVATDMAGNIEQKTARREFTFNNGGQEFGDVNGDSQITPQDASLILQIIAKKIKEDAEGISIKAVDVNGDGLITPQDASLILQYIAKKISW